MASAGVLIVTGRPSMMISPLVSPWCTPARHSKNSERPAPASPAIPRTSPWRTLREIFFKERRKLPIGGVYVRFFTSRATSPFSVGSFGYCSLISRPTIILIISSLDVSAALTVPIYWPSRITVSLSAILNISSIRCVI